MKQEQRKISKGWKIWTISGIVIYIAAMVYEACKVFSKDNIAGGGYSNLIIMAILFVVMLTSLRPVFKMW